MCLIVFSFRPGSTLPLALAANRDEFHARPTRSARFLPEQPHILAGLDLRAGGTWLGLDRAGRFAAITNFRDPGQSHDGARSRGELVMAFLNDNQQPGEFLQAVAERGRDYAGFSLLIGDSAQMWYFSNCPLPEGGRAGPQRLKSGIYGLSNAHLDTPWPKVESGKAGLASALQRGAPDHDGLAAVVADQRLADPGALQIQGHSTAMERQLSAQFIVTPEYGTRSCTTLWLRDDGMCHFRELSFDPSGRTTQRRTFIYRASQKNQGL